MSQIKIPELSLVVLIGISGSGKSTFAARHFRPTEVISSDFCRGAGQRRRERPGRHGGRLRGAELHRGQAARRRAADGHRRDQRPGRGPAVADRAGQAAPRAGRGDRPGRARAHLRGAQRRPARPRFRRARAAPAARPAPPRPARPAPRGLPPGLRAGRRAGRSTRPPSSASRCGTTGAASTARSTSSATCTAATTSWPSCWSGSATRSPPTAARPAHPDGRTAVFVGDLVDRGPATPAVLRLVMGMTAAGTGLSRGRQPRGQAGPGAARPERHRVATAWPRAWPSWPPSRPSFTAQATAFMDGLLGHLVLDDGKLVVAHAGLPEAMHGRASAAVRSFALYGDTTGETDEFGLPVRYPWAEDYRGRAMVVYGHTPVPEAEWVNGTICLDTGCVFGGRLTALRYPERELVSVPAGRVYFEPARPLAPAGRATAAGQAAAGPSAREPDELRHRRRASASASSTTRLTGGTVTIREENALAALEVMSRFAIDPRWLVYLPPTMAPTGDQPGRAGCWSTRARRSPRSGRPAWPRWSARRSTWARGRSWSPAATATSRPAGSACGRSRASIYTRTGRAFFADPAVERAVLGRVSRRHRRRRAVGRAGHRLAGAGLRAAALVGQGRRAAARPVRAGRRGRGRRAGAAAAALTAAGRARRRRGRTAGAAPSSGGTWPAGSPPPTAGTAGRWTRSTTCAWPRSRSWPGRAQVHALRPHRWHLDRSAAWLCEPDPVTVPADRVGRRSRSADPASEAAATRLVGGADRGGRRGHGGQARRASCTAARRGWPSPASSAAGREYLRIIYGPEYTGRAQPGPAAQPATSATSAPWRCASSRSASRRWSGSSPAEPLYRVHECVFGVLALESEPVDPRL